MCITWLKADVEEDETRGRHGRRQQGVWLFGVSKWSRRERGSRTNVNLVASENCSMQHMNATERQNERERKRIEVCEGTVILLPLALAWHCWSFEHSCNPVRCVCVSVCVLPPPAPPTALSLLSVCAPRRSESLHFIFVYHLFSTQFFYYFSRARLPRWGQLISYAK